jgi:hypothetical protein
MTAAEARQATLKFNAQISETWALLYDIRERRGWEALGYANFAAYVQAELRVERSHAYRLADAGRVVQLLSPIGGTISNERQARELAAAGDENILRVYKQAAASAPEGALTARHIRETVETLGLGPNKWGAKTEATRFRDDAAAMLKMNSEQLARILLRLVEKGRVKHAFLSEEIECERGFQLDPAATRKETRRLGEWLDETARGSLL